MRLKLQSENNRSPASRSARFFGGRSGTRFGLGEPGDLSWCGTDPRWACGLHFRILASLAIGHSITGHPPKKKAEDALRCPPQILVTVCRRKCPRARNVRT